MKCVSSSEEVDAERYNVDVARNHRMDEIYWSTATVLISPRTHQGDLRVSREVINSCIREILGAKRAMNWVLGGGAH